MDVRTKKYPLDERIDGCVHDAADIIHRLSRLSPKEGSTIEIVSDLPAVTDPDILIGMVMRWRDVAQHFKCKLRIYAWSHTEEVEKWLLKCVQNSDQLYVTILPTYLRKGFMYE